MMNKPLFEGPNLRLTAINPDTDAIQEARWTLDLDYAESLRNSYGRPMMLHEIKKLQEKMLKEADEKRNQFHFAIRLLDETLIGFVHLPWVSWPNGICQLQMNFGEPAMLEMHGDAIIQMILRYIYTELNLYRVTASSPEYNGLLIHLYRQAGFSEEVRQREYCFRNGQLWDRLIFGLLRDEWAEVQLEAVR
jgi:RimJ/RimL family protein N-acetyltransferase